MAGAEAQLERRRAVTSTTGPGDTETADRDGLAVLGGAAPKTRQEPAQARESVSSHMATCTGSIDYALAIRAAVACAEFKDRTLQAWAARAGVSPEILVRAGIVPRLSAEIRGDLLEITVAPCTLPIRAHGEPDEEFIERARRMRW